MTADIHMPFFSNINLDLVKTQAWVPQQIFATEGDNGYGQIFSLYENGNPYTSATVANLNFRAIKPDNNIVDIKNGQGFKAIDGQSNQFAFQVPAQTFQATGRVECYFYVTSSDGGILASTTHFFYEVQRSVPSETGSVSYIASLQGIVDEANALKKQADDLVAGLSESKTNASTMVNDFQNDLISKEQDIGKKADQMLADAKTALDKTTGAATDYQQQLDALNQKYIEKYNELLAQLPSASDAVKKQIADALAQIKDDEQDEFQKISMDWVNKKQALDDSITTYKDSVTKELDALKSQIAGLSGDNVAQLSKQIDDLQTKLNGMHLADYYTKKEIDDKLDNFQPIDTSNFETVTHAEQTYAKKSDIVAPDLSGYETKTDAEQTYAKKTDIPAPQDLSDYAKTSDVAKTYETKADADNTYAKKTDIVAPDLSGYETSSHAEQTYETKADAATHITKDTADATYANKADIPDLSDYAKKSDIPKGQDLSAYETKEDAESTYAKKSDIPAAPDLSSYAKSEDVSKTYETKADAATHLTKTQADADYATKDDLANVKPNMTGYAKTTDIPDISEFETSSHAEQTYETKKDASFAIKKINIIQPKDAVGQTSTAETPDIGGHANGTFELNLADIVNQNYLQDALRSYLTQSDASTIYAKKSDVSSVGSAKSFKVMSGDVSDDDLDTEVLHPDANGEVDLTVLGQPITMTELTTHPDNWIEKSKDWPYNFFAVGQDLYVNGEKVIKEHNLSGYLTKTDADTTYAKKTDIPTVPDMSNYLTKTDASSTYATKDDLKNASTSSQPDLSQYLTKSEAGNTYFHEFEAYEQRIRVRSDYDSSTQKFNYVPYPDTIFFGQNNGLATGTYYRFPAIITADNGDSFDMARVDADKVAKMSDTDDGLFFNYNKKLYALGHRFLDDDDAKTFATKSDIPKLTAYKSNVELAVQTTTLTPDSSNGYNATSEEIAMPSVVTVKNAGYAFSNSMNYPNMIFMNGKDLYINGNKYSPSTI